MLGSEHTRTEGTVDRIVWGSEDTGNIEDTVDSEDGTVRTVWTVRTLLGQ